MTKKTGFERRVHPRIEQRLALKVAVNGYDFITSTQNVSCVGAYCHINKYMPPFTKVMVKLDLPIIEQNRSKHLDLQCRGVVVRTEDASSGGFNIAIFFDHINDSQRNKISQYVSQFLSQQPSLRQ
ncbi:MAG: PilZ domain-containing protein [Candidatus Omnitrophica bacterium]|nr:PilZ domain-containing protein [Candidatus Omnitrophota bacterium]